ncbi:DUF3658 domain-containing protein [Ochrobactrum sp. GPK 3]|uniref:DUF3658 domain-containing protein n=1 Tax=Brucella sp. 22210 TaxID=3453892 RepID=UPI0031385E87
MPYRDFFHICMAGTAADNIQQQLDIPPEQIFAFHDDLTYGPLEDIDTNAVQRTQFLQEVFDPETLTNLEKTCGLNEELLMEARKLQPETPRTSKPIVIWHGTHPGEQLLLRRAVYALRNQIRPLYELNVNSSLIDTPHEITAVALLGVDKVKSAWDNVEIIDRDRREFLIADWQRLRQHQGIRHALGERLTTHPIHIHDAQILELVKEQWTEQNRVIGHAMAEIQGCFATDTFVKWRIRKLASQNHIETKKEQDGGFWVRASQTN